MEALQIENTKDVLTIRLDKSSFSNQYISNLITQLRTEYLIHKADFDESIEEIGDEIKQNWWTKNRAKIMEKIENFQQND